MLFPSFYVFHLIIDFYSSFKKFRLPHILHKNALKIRPESFDVQTAGRIASMIIGYFVWNLREQKVFMAKTKPKEEKKKNFLNISLKLFNQHIKKVKLWEERGVEIHSKHTHTHPLYIIFYYYFSESHFPFIALSTLVFQLK